MPELTAEAFVAALRRYRGITENPAGSNRQPFAEMAGHANGQFWCLTFDVGVMKSQFGKLVIPNTASTRTLWLWGQQHGLVVPGGANAPVNVGDFILFDFPGGYTPTDHVAVARAFVGAHQSIPTIEGNTSSDDRGAQTNGGGVFDRLRPRTYVRGVVRPIYEGLSKVPVQEDEMPLSPEEHNLLQEVRNIVGNLQAIDPWHQSTEAEALDRVRQLQEAVADIVGGVDAQAVADAILRRLGEAADK